MEHLDGDIKDVVVFGDEKNDLSMFISEWASIAMGNATEEIKKLSTEITLDNDHDGIKVIVEKYLL